MLGGKGKVELLPEISGDVFKVARERLNIRPEDLGARACLSKKYILQLEAGGGSCFFSEEHKISVAKKVGKLLNLEEEQFLIYPDGIKASQASLPFESYPESNDIGDGVPEQNEYSKKDTVIKPLANLGEVSDLSEIPHKSRQWVLRFLLMALVVVGLYITRVEIVNLFVESAPAPQPSQTIETTNSPVDIEPSANSSQKQQ